MPEAGDQVDVSQFVDEIVGAISPSLLEERPFESDEEYWQLAHALIQTKAIAQEIRENRGRWLDLLNKPERFESARALGLELNERDNRLLSTWRLRSRQTGAGPAAPRMIRFASRESLSEPECLILLFLIHQTLAPTSTFGNPSVGDIATTLNLSPSDFLALLSPDSRLNRLGVIHLERDILGNPKRRDVRMELPAVKALRGLPLDRDEEIALGVRALEDLLLEERGEEATDETLESALQEPTSEAEPIHHSTWDDEFDEPEPFDEQEDLAAAEDELLEEIERISSDVSDDLAPFKDDLDYLQAYQEWFKQLLKRRELERDLNDYHRTPDVNPTIIRRQLELKAKLAKTKIDQRLAATRRAGGWLPRGEKLAEIRSLEDFEKHVLLLLTCLTISPSLEQGGFSSGIRDVGRLLAIFFETFEEQVLGRRYFDSDAPLIRESLLILGGRGLEDLMTLSVEIDRGMVEYLLGRKAERGSDSEGANLYTPRIDLDRVVLNEIDKRTIVRAAESFPRFQELRKESGLNEIIPTGNNLVFLFYGPSGTGKTMLANALATHLGKRVLLINFPTLGFFGDEVVRFVFREAKVHNAIIFFDECEGMFASRDRRDSTVVPLLTEIERHDGMVILATNRPYDLDEAMHRRITIAVEFHPPDIAQREAIWRAHLPEKLAVSGDIDLAALARRFELTGGLIKNAVVAALSIAAADDGDHPVVTQEMLEEGARLQMRGRLTMRDFEDRLVPRRGLGDLVVPDSLRAAIVELIDLEKARQTLTSEWGFNRDGRDRIGNTALFYGPPGTGKTLAAEVVGWELGRPLKRVSAARLLSKWVGEGAKNIEALFAEARNNDAVLLFDEADALFAGRTDVRTSTDRYANLEVSILLREIEEFEGVVILTTNLPESIDPAFRRRIRFHLEFGKPDGDLRAVLWRKHIPEQTPLDESVSFETLGRDHELTGAQIRNAVLRAAARAALRDAAQRTVTMSDLRSAAETESASSDNKRAVGF